MNGLFRGCLLLCAAGLLAGCSGERRAAPEVEPVDGVVAKIVADATIRRDQPAQNFGNRRELEVEQERDVIRAFLMRFSVEGVGDRQVTGARLLLKCSDESDFGGSFQATDSGWDEAEVTWNSAPPQGKVLGTLDGVREGAFYEVDLSQLIDGDGVYDIRVSSVSSDTAGYLSRENRVNGPVLEIDVAPKSQL
jgi:hypothetical protein